ncbi:MAG: hypothetical protein VX346_01570 [Planctomycetota bacterium]|nr:hypothetical protein [Planctomycetota bacterium]
MKKYFCPLGVVLLTALLTSPLQAHFIWLALHTKDGQPQQGHLYFGESTEPDEAAYLDRLTKLRLWTRIPAGQYTTAPTEKVTTDDGGYLDVNLSGGVGALEAECLFGVFGQGERTMLLHYYAKAIAPEHLAKLGRSSKLDFDVVPHWQNGILQVTVLWKGRPVPASQLIVTDSAGDDQELTTDHNGNVQCRLKQLAGARLRARRTVKKPGQLAGQDYREQRQYCTVTFATPPANTPDTSNQKTVFPELPQGVTSLGAAIVENWLYTYGGHFGRAHHYSKTSQSSTLRRLNLDDPQSWEVVAQGPRLQGLAMVSYQGKLYRIGGFTAHNSEDEEHDLRSVADVASFDPETKKWSALPPLPEPRSSHDAVVVNDQLYVVGGWALGSEESQWHQTAFQMDLSQATPRWVALPQPPFQRRALSVGHFQGKLYVIGGMQKQGGPTTQVAVFDPATQNWSTGAPLLGAGMEGFGSAAWNLNGRLYVSTYGGRLQSLSTDTRRWEVATALQEDRFFHRMMAWRGHLVLVGGASMEAGKRLALETVKVSAEKPAAIRTSPPAGGTAPTD